MPTYDHRTAALDALVAHLASAMSTASLAVPVSREWGDDTEADRKPRSTARSHIVVTGGRATEEPCRAFARSTTSTKVRTAVGRWTMPAQVDVFSDLRDDLTALLPIVRAAFHPASAAHPRLVLTSGDYYDEAVSWRVLALQSESGEGPPRGEWRGIIEIEGRGYTVVESDAVDAMQFTTEANVSGTEITTTTTE